MTLTVAALAPVTSSGQEPNEAFKSSSYTVAFYSSALKPRLLVFPIRGPVVSIPLPLKLYRVAYRADGTALYGGGDAPEGPNQSQLYKIEFNPVRATALAGSRGLSPSAGLAISAAADRVLLSGVYRHSGISECGLFELNLSEGRVRTIIGTSECSYASTWTSLSLSPDGRQAISIRKHRLEVIDLAAPSARPIGEGYIKAAWSPDGKWIAALENGAGWRTKLLDTSEFKIRKILGTTEVAWSPDSRYLLAVKPCGPDYGTIETVDIETGKQRTIPSSKCKVNQTTTGWVSSSITPKQF